MNNKYKFDKTLCDLLQLNNTNYYSINDIINMIIPTNYINKSRFKFSNTVIAQYFNKTCNDIVWLSNLKDMIKDLNQKKIIS